MTAGSLFRLSGIALMLALPLSLVGTLMHPRSERIADIVASGSWQSASHALVAVAFLLLLLGLPGVYAAHASHSGVLGLIGFIFVILFVAFHVYRLPFEAGAVAALAADRDAERLLGPGGPAQAGMLGGWGALTGLLGPLLFGVSLVRSGIYPRLTGWLVAAWTPLFLGLTVAIGTQPSATRDALLDAGIANVGIALSYFLLTLGLAICGYQLWRAKQSVARGSG